MLRIDLQETIPLLLIILKSYEAVQALHLLSDMLICKMVHLVQDLYILELFVHERHVFYNPSTCRHASTFR